MKRLQQNEARFARDREDILRTLGGLDSGLANLNVDPDYFVTGPGSVAAGAVTQEKKKKRRDTSVSASGMDIDSPGAMTPGGNSLALLGLGPANKGRKTDAKQAASGKFHPLSHAILRILTTPLSRAPRPCQLHYSHRPTHQPDQIWPRRRTRSLIPYPQCPSIVRHPCYHRRTRPLTRPARHAHARQYRASRESPSRSSRRRRPQTLSRPDQTRAPSPKSQTRAARRRGAARARDIRPT